MAIVNKKSSVYAAMAATGMIAATASSAHGVIARVAGTITNDATDNSGSTYLMLAVPASAIILPESAIKTTGWGFAQATIGVAGDTAALLNVTKATGGGTGNNPVVLFDAKWNKPIWKQLGLAADPGTLIELVVSTATDATGAGTIDFDLVFANHV